jgi:hypothetical protein
MTSAAAPASRLTKKSKTSLKAKHPKLAERPIYVVLGTHRSGSSLCAHLMQAFGFNMSDQANPDPHNVKGYWEHSDIMLQHDRLLNAFGRNVYTAAHALPLPPEWWKLPVVKPIKRKLTSYLTGLMVSPKRLGFKDPRTVRFLPMWFEIFRELSLAPKFIMCLRDPAQVARSLQARDGINPALGEYRWMLYAVDFFRYTNGLPRCIIEYDDWFVEGMPNLRKLTKFLDLSDMGADAAPPLIAAEIVDPVLRHGGSTPLRANNIHIQRFYNLTKRTENEPHLAGAIADAVMQFELVQEFVRLFEPIIGSHSGATTATKDNGRAIVLPKHQDKIGRSQGAAALSKTEIVNALARKRGFSSYLEISTGKTGNHFADVDRTQLTTCHRLMYQCPDDYSDGLEIDFRTRGVGISPFFAEVRRRGTKYDIMLVDSSHTYECSMRDLSYALSALVEGGVLVVHDCDPPEKSGVTYPAFVDFVLGRDDIDYYTVDADFGCGVIKKGSLLPSLDRLSAVPATEGLRLFWEAIRSDETLRYVGFEKRKREFLRMISVREFFELESLDALHFANVQNRPASRNAMRLRSGSPLER